MEAHPQVCDETLHNVVGFIDKFKGVSSVSPKSFENLAGSPLYFMSGAFDDEVVEVGTEGCLKNSEGLEEGGGREEGVGDSPANCLGGGI